MLQNCANAAYEVCRICAVLYSGRVKGVRGKREGHWSFLFPRRGLSGLKAVFEFTGELDKNRIYTVSVKQQKLININKNLENIYEMC